jgi:two-component system response regulator AtoC
MEIKTSKRLLIIDDEENMRHMLTVLLKKTGYLADTAADGQHALDMIGQTHYDFILCDLKMPNLDGMAFLKQGKEKLESTTVIMMSAYGNIDTAIEAMKMGAYDYISKPFKTDEVYLTLKKAEERESLRRENILLKERIREIQESYHFGNMVGKSKAMQEVFHLASKAAQYNTTVLISGESGTGKELIAKGIHFQGERAQRPFIPINCGGIPENLLESEFFGYKKGSFTGADRNKKGLFEEANGGTLFLDEIGELPLTLQVKFLRVLQENEVMPIGESKPRSIDVRIIAATARNLEEEVKKGLFRQELFYRLNVLPIRLPPLRERIEDIPLLIRNFIAKFSKDMDKTVSGVSPEALSLLLKYSWHGNVRELENTIERAMILAEQDILLPENFSAELSQKSSLLQNNEPSGSGYDGYSLKEAQRELEKRIITKALIATGGNRTKASQLLEISHPSLLTKIKAYNIEL